MFYTHVFPRKVVVLLTSKNDQRKHARHPYRPKDDDDAFRAILECWLVRMARAGGKVGKVDNAAAPPPAEPTDPSALTHHSEGAESGG